jgi:hypothetical protein
MCSLVGYNRIDASVVELQQVSDTFASGGKVSHTICSLAALLA